MASKDGRRSAIIHVTNATIFLSHCRSVDLYESRVYAVGGESKGDASKGCTKYSEDINNSGIYFLLLAVVNTGIYVAL